MIRMIRMNHPNLGFQIRASGPPRWDVAVAVGSPTARTLKTLRFPLFGRSAGLFSSLSEISQRFPTKARMCDFPRELQYLRPECDPDCSHGNILHARRSRVILWIILLAFHPCLFLDGALA